MGEDFVEWQSRDHTIKVVLTQCTISYGKDDPANKSIKKKFRAPSGFEPLIICV